VISDDAQTSSSSKVTAPVSNLVCLSDSNVPVVKPVEVVPLSPNPALTKSAAEPTTNSTVSSVKVTDNPNCATLLYKPNTPIVPKSSLVNITQGTPTTFQIQMNNQNNVTDSSPIVINENLTRPATSFVGPHQSIPINDKLSEPRVLPLHQQCNVQFSDQNVVTPVRDKL
jgi:hypothetical protein